MVQSAEQELPPVAVVFDCDMGTSIDDALALALLYGFDGMKEARVVSVSVSRPSLSAAAFCEVMGRFYSGAVDGAFASQRRTLPVGLFSEGQPPADTAMLAAPLSKRNDDGTLVYPHDIEKLNDTADPVALIRNALTAQHDGNCVVLLAGPATNLVRVLDLPGVKDLISAKVKFLSIALGAYSGGPPEAGVMADPPAARRLLAGWPTPIVAVGEEIGRALPFPAVSIERDFGWAAHHPLVDAYLAYRTMPYDAPATAMAAALYTVRPEQNYFRLSKPGVISVVDDGRTIFTPSSEGKHRYLIVDPAQRERLIQTYTEIASAQPVPRRPRQRTPQEPPQPALKDKPAQQPKAPDLKPAPLGP
ncbi:MAG: nucleoside hydrolase [Acidobacteriota bacterium]